MAPKGPIFSNVGLANKCLPQANTLAYFIGTSRIKKFCNIDTRVKHSKNLRTWPLIWRHDTQHNDTQHNNTHHNNDLPLCWVELCWVSYFLFFYDECHCTKCRYAECHGAYFNTCKKGSAYPWDLDKSSNCQKQTRQLICWEHQTILISEPTQATWPKLEIL